MKYDRIILLFGAGASLTCAPIAAAATPIRAGGALPSSQTVTTDKLPVRTLKVMQRKEHLQGADGAGAGDSTGLVVAGLGVAGIAATLGIGLSEGSNRPDSP